MVVREDVQFGSDGHAHFRKHFLNLYPDPAYVFDQLVMREHMNESGNNGDDKERRLHHRCVTLIITTASTGWKYWHGLDHGHAD